MLSHTHYHHKPPLLTGQPGHLHHTHTTGHTEYHHWPLPAAHISIFSYISDVIIIISFIFIIAMTLFSFRYYASLLLLFIISPTDILLLSSVSLLISPSFHFDIIITIIFLYYYILPSPFIISFIIIFITPNTHFWAIGHTLTHNTGFSLATLAHIITFTQATVIFTHTTHTASHTAIEYSPLATINK